MNFFKDTTVTTDQQIQETYYPGLESEADGIDLRIEMNRILYGTPFKKPLGHWVVVRHFSEESSSYFNRYTKEGVNGPARKYTDTILRARRVPVRMTRGELDSEKAGTLNMLNYTYYFEWNVEIRPGDQIYELDTKNHANKPTAYNFTEKYDVKQVHPYRLENGNVQYLSIISEFNNITY